MGGRALRRPGVFRSGFDFLQVETFLPVLAPCIPARDAGCSSSMLPVRCPQAHHAWLPVPQAVMCGCY